MAKTSAYLHWKWNILFNKLFLEYIKTLNKPQSEVWEVKDYEDFAEFLGKERNNFNHSKLKQLGHTKATEADCKLLQEKLNLLTYKIKKSKLLT